MKSKLKSVRNGSPCATPLQASNQPSSRGPNGRKEVAPSCLCIYDRTAQEVVSEVPLRDEEFCGAVIEANRQGILPGQFFAHAIRDQLCKLSGAPAPAGGAAPRPQTKTALGNAHPPCPTAPAPEDLDLIAGDLTLRLSDSDGSQLGKVKIDDLDFERLQKAAAASHVSLTEIMEFITLRQLEAFHFRRQKGVPSVADIAVSEISTGLETADRNLAAAWAVSCALVEFMKRLGCEGEYSQAVTDICKVRGLATTIERMVCETRACISDANAHWKTAASPALLERPVVPVSVPLLRAAA